MKTTELRKKASLYRKAASFPTDGAGDTDLLLLRLADEFELQASELERANPPRQRSPG